MVIKHQQESTERRRASSVTMLTLRPKAALMAAADPNTSSMAWVMGLRCLALGWPPLLLVSANAATPPPPPWSSATFWMAVCSLHYAREHTQTPSMKRHGPLQIPCLCMHNEEKAHSNSVQSHGILHCCPLMCQYVLSNRAVWQVMLDRLRTVGKPHCRPYLPAWDPDKHVVLITLSPKRELWRQLCLRILHETSSRYQLLTLARTS